MEWMRKEEELRALYDGLRSLCHPLLKELSKNLVPGEGNPDSLVVFIGEAPGRDEDKQGRPFVGAAGKYLAEVLEEVGFRRDDAYITNVVKRRPPGNRPPRKGEVGVFLPYLRCELEIVSHKVVCLLGATAVKALLDRPLGEVRGKLIEEGGWTFFSTYHPEAVTYDPSVGRVFEQDIKMLKEIVEKTRIRTPHHFSAAHPIQSTFSEQGD